MIYIFYFRNVVKWDFLVIFQPLWFRRNYYCGDLRHGNIFIKIQFLAVASLSVNFFFAFSPLFPFRGFFVTNDGKIVVILMLFFGWSNWIITLCSFKLGKKTRESETVTFCALLINWDIHWSLKMQQNCSSGSLITVFEKSHFRTF